MAIDQDTQARLDALIAQGEGKGCVNLSEFSELMQEAGLDDAATHDVHDQLDSRGLDLSDDCGRTDVADLRYDNDDVSHVTTDALQMSSTSCATTRCSAPRRRPSWPSASSAATSRPRSG